MRFPRLENLLKTLLVCGIGICFPFAGYAIDPAALALELEGNQKITIIDIRPNVIYRQSHIHNAINVPASIIEHKRLPPLGRVVVYNEGIDIAALEQAVLLLNAKPGIQAEALEGGFTAWSARNNVIQSEKGLTASRTRNLTYQQVKKLAQRYDSLLLVDLRMGAQQESLVEHFPNVQVYDPIGVVQDDVNDVNVSSYILETIPKGNQQVLILIDDANGLSEKLAAKLHAARVKRLAILVGGEQALRSRGKSSQEVRNSGD